MYETQTRLTPNGELTCRLFGVDLKLVGGSYYAKPERMPGVKMAAEIDLPARVSIPTEDFNVPDWMDMEAGLIAVGRMAVMREGPVYVGCMGGVGRTGLFMAMFAAMCGEQDPVGFVRKHYMRSAVETEQQRKWIALAVAQSIPRVRRRMMKIALGHQVKMPFWKMTWADRALFLRMKFGI